MPTHDATSADTFTARLRESGLLSADDFPDSASSHDASAIAEDLVRAGKLTRFQSAALLAGRLDDLHIGKYEILDQLGKGGMGTVFKARHRRMKRVVALKVLSPEVASQGSFVQRFQREVETIAQLSHPNVVMAFDADEAEAGHFLVMEFVSGRDLASEVFQNGTLSVAEGVDCIIQAARGLEFAHARTIVHRDIKPANLMRDTSGVVKVADLGLARLTAGPGGDPTSASLTQAGGIVGTTEYMAPEQALDSTTIDQRADIYSLGCTLYFLLAGKAPYAGNSIMGLLLKHREAPIPAIRDHRTDVPHALDAIFARMVAKKPDDRYPSMSDVISNLEALRNRTSLPTTRLTQKPAPAAVEMTTLADSAQLLASQDTKQTSPSSIVGKPTSSAVGRIADLTVVLVESSRTQAGIIRKYFEQLGIAQIQTTTSGKQAVEAVRTHNAHAVVSGLHLSDMTGVQLAQALRADAACASVGFVLMTSEEAAEASVLATLPQALVLQKPFDLRKLAEALAKVTGRIPG